MIHSKEALAQKLKDKLKQSDLEEELRTRLHRAISWLRCAENQKKEPDLNFLSLWISFNACYAIELTESETVSEREKFRRFISTLVNLDEEGRIFSLLWQTFPGPVRLIIDNRYVFRPFWNYHRGEAVEWEESFRKSNAEALMCLSANRVDDLLHIILDRLYVLRNQLFHGGATFESKVNRSQVKDGAAILASLVPIVVDIIMANPDEDWGRLMFPVISE
jgi:hypothetical protein